MNDILIVAGPSAVGKTTIAWEMLKNDDRFEFVRSATTREVRGDSYSSEYIYISREEFEELIRTEGVLEWTEYAGAYYGTPRSEITRIHGAGKIPLLILDVVGVHSLMEKKDLSVCGVYVYDDIKVMQGRIFERYLGNGEDPDGRRRYESRKRQNEEDYRNLPNIIDDFYALVKNEDTPEEGAKRVAAAFRRFEERIPKDAGENLRLAKEIQKTVV
jgi:guanylate kinase